MSRTAAGDGRCEGERSTGRDDLGRHETLAARLGAAPLDGERTVALLGPVVRRLETEAWSGRRRPRLAPAAITLAPRISFADAIDEASAAYRAPEEAQGGAATAASNVYSLGRIAAACLTGTPSWPPERAEGQGAAADEPARLPGITVAVDEVIATALAEEPRDRHCCPSALMRALERAVDGGVERRRQAQAATGARPGRAALKGGRGSRATRTAWHRAQSGKRPIRAPAVFVVGIALLASALAGFALGGDRSDPGHAGSSRLPQARPAVVTGTVVPAMERLDARRSALRRRLRDAERPAAAGALAAQIASAYADAWSALQLAPGLPSAATAALAQRLRDVELAYRELARAGRSQRRQAWRRASPVVEDRERQLDRLLAAHRWS